MNDVSLLYVTTGSADEAARIGAALVEARLVACANIVDGMQSIYRWQGEINRDREAILIVKTQTRLVSTVTARIQALHSYECPCVLAFAAAGGNAAFVQWIVDQTSGDEDGRGGQ